MPRSAAPLPIAERAARLRYTPLFSGLPARDIRRLAEACRTLEADPGETVISQGDDGDTFYLVVQGLLRAERVDAGGQRSILQDIHKGEFFGEFALLDDVRRTASVVVRSDATFMTLGREDFDAISGRHKWLVRRVRRRLEQRRAQHVEHPNPDRAQVLERLSRMLEGISPAVLADLDAQLEWVRVPSGTEVITEGTPGNCMFFVSRGVLYAIARNASGSEVRIGEIRAGEPVGEAALISDSPRNATVRAVTECELVRLSRVAFRTLIGLRPDLEKSFRRMIERRHHLRLERLQSARPDGPAFPTLQEIETVFLDPDPIERNYGITRLYHRIGVALTRLLGSEDVNWPLIGARASYTAGFTIRKEDLRLPQIVGGPWLQAQAWIIERVIRNSVVQDRVDAALDTASVALAAGNLRIFAEIGSVLGRFLLTFGEDEAYDGEKLAAFLATLVDGPVETGGQDLLKRGLTCWYEAAFQGDHDTKSEKLFLGNCLLALHEQTRVQPDVDEALEAPLRLAVGDELGRWIFERPVMRYFPLRRQLQGLADHVEHAFVRTIAHIVRHGATRMMMRLSLPEGDLWLGRAVRKSITSPQVVELATIQLPELQDFLQAYAKGGSGGAGDWASLKQRMRYIVALFRAVQKDRAFFEAPSLQPTG